MESKFIFFHIPEETPLLAEIGKVALLHEQLNYMLRMTIKSIAEVPLQDALDATTYASSATLRDRILKLGRRRLGEGPALIKLQALMQQCERVTRSRNELLHAVWTMELDGDPQLRTNDHQSIPVPTIQQLADLGTAIFNVTNRIIFERAEGGFLHEALGRSNPAKPPE